jgi:hypothetical protein
MDARDSYRTGLERRVAEADRLRRTAGHYAWSRLAVGVAAVATFWGVIGPAAMPWPWLIAPAAAFLALVKGHEVVLRGLTRAERGAAFHRQGLARLDGCWAGAGDAGLEHAADAHPYAAELDLFGRGSLFELLSRARTRLGAETLAGWLKAPADPDVVRSRQAAVEELRGRTDLREDLEVLGEDVAGLVDTQALAAWGEAPGVLPSSAVMAVVPRILGPVNVAAVLWWLSPFGGPWPLLASGLASAGVALAMRGRTAAVLRAAGRGAADLRLLAEIVRRLEVETFRAPRLAELRGALGGAGEPASRRIARLARLIEWNDSRQNQIFAPAAALWLLGTRLAFAAESWRAASGGAVRRWVEALAEVEALSSLAGHAFEHPLDPFPELVDAGPVLEAEGLGHPLLDESACVRNDVRLGNGLGLLLVSGSNMSGKSTLLRSIGLNAALAQAGAPVRARRLRLSALQVGACMRVQDSLLGGTSRFYAEILRLKQLVEMGRGAPPLLFLLDEVLHGTNSHDRRIGAAALLRGLLDMGAVGLVTTHDLALARLADDLAPRAANVHFEDHVEGGRMTFDFVLRPGVVAKSNALALMRAVGLEVPEP